MADPESISSGRTLPQWMKLRPDVKYDADGGTAFSPPAHDDSFFVIRYPVAEPSTGSSVQSLTDALSDAHVTKPSPPVPVMPAKNLNKHTEPCKAFINNNEPQFVNVKNQTKPFGTDDGFDGPGAACGTSIVKVARQMVSGKSLTRGFTVANFPNDIEAHPEQADTADFIKATAPSSHTIDTSQTDFMSSSRYMSRRGSKSLPASPLGSPKSMRKAQPNPFFTGAVDAQRSPAAAAGGWFLSSLLGIQREVAASTNSVVSNISEETEEAVEVAATAAARQSNVTVAGSNSAAANFMNKKVLKAKPSELREMNFWSPTSM